MLLKIQSQSAFHFYYFTSFVNAWTDERETELVMDIPRTKELAVGILLITIFIILLSSLRLFAFLKLFKVCHFGRKGN